MSDATHYEQQALWGEEQIFDREHELAKCKAVEQLLADAPPDTLLDVGAGDGRVLRHLSRAGVGKVHLVAERSMAALVHVTAPSVQSGIDALPLADRSVDGAICCEVLEHLPGPIFDRARSELSRVARDVVVVTVPNRERRARAEVRCHRCGCRYNPDRHLRSFAPAHLDGLLEDFRVERVIEAGRRQPFYPRWARLLLERTRVLRRPGSPTCPQCGAVYRFAQAPTASTTAPMGDADPSANGSRDPARRGYDIARRLAPKHRHPYYLCARFRRVR